MQFDVESLVKDCGGPRAFAKIIGRSRTAAYRAINTGYLATPQLCRVLEHRPEIQLNDYFQPEGADNARTGAE